MRRYTTVLYTAGVVAWSFLPLCLSWTNITKKQDVTIQTTHKKKF